MLKYATLLLIVGSGGYLCVSGNPSGEIETLTIDTSRFLARTVDILKEGIDDNPKIVQLGSMILSIICTIAWALFMLLNRHSSLQEVLPVAPVVERKQEEPKVVQEAKARALKSQLQSDKHILECKQRTLCEVMPKTKDELAKAQKSLIDTEKTLEYKRRLVRELCDKMEDQQADFMTNERDLQSIAAELDKLKSVV